MAPDTVKLQTCRFHAVLIGTCVGDAIGLPREGMSRRRAERRFGRAPLRHRFIFGRGMMSDDTEHACMTAQALLASGGDIDRFAQSLAWRLRGWILALPAGVGLATARAILKLWIGFPPSCSGVWSAGNGPAMRAAVIGVYAADDVALLKRLLHASTVVTHRDPAAEHGALAVSLAAMSESPTVFWQLAREHLHGTAMLELLERIEKHESLDSYVAAFGAPEGISGWINQTVPAAIFCWLKWPNDYRAAVEAIVLAGGDTDSTAAIVGGLVAINTGVEGIPAEWRDGIIEWPRTKRWFAELAEALARGARPVRLFWPGLVIRNVFFLAIVFLHGLRRLIP